MRKPRAQVFEQINNIQYKMGTTYVGRAIDFARLSQFK